jgi:hypothetical protein
MFTTLSAWARRPASIGTPLSGASIAASRAVLVLAGFAAIVVPATTIAALGFVNHATAAIARPFTPNRVVPAIWSMALFAKRGDKRTAPKIPEANPCALSPNRLAISKPAITTSADATKLPSRVNAFSPLRDLGATFLGFVFRLPVWAVDMRMIYRLAIVGHGYTLKPNHGSRGLGGGDFGSFP